MCVCVSFDTSLAGCVYYNPPVCVWNPILFHFREDILRDSRIKLPLPWLSPVWWAPTLRNEMPINNKKSQPHMRVVSLELVLIRPVEFRIPNRGTSSAYFYPPFGKRKFNKREREGHDNDFSTFWLTLYPAHFLAVYWKYKGGLFHFLLSQEKRREELFIPLYTNWDGFRRGIY